MPFNQYRRRVAASVAALFAALCGAAGLLVGGWWYYALLCAPLAAWAVVDLYRGHVAGQQELAEFLAAVRYRDFSRRFALPQARPEVRLLRTGFNEINAAFRRISWEKETQYQHLQNILELVTTGILSYETDTGQVWWLNEALKQQLRLPHLKTLNGLAHRYPSLAAQIAALRPGAPVVVTVLVGPDAVRLLLSATLFVTDGRPYRLVAFQNISEALEESETEAWQKLLRVLTHEIMNSVAPIASLADTLHQRLAAAQTPREIPELLEDLEVGLRTIQKRSAGLLQFAATYRNLSKVSTPQLQQVRVSEVFATVHTLMQPTLQARNITLDVVLAEAKLALTADPVMMEQVLINLVVNAMDAVKSQLSPRITLSAAAANPGKVVIQVADNGAGMEAEVLDKIFVPFFTTKKNGSGIGLSLCKQIMLLHKGSIRVRSEPGVGTVVALSC